MKSVQYCGCNKKSLVSCLEFEFGNIVNVCQKHEEIYCKKASRLDIDFKKMEVIYA